MKIKKNEYVYLALNKPKGYVCALKDNVNPTIIEIIKEKYKGLHIAGRLDKDTTGLIILTNDGRYTHNATHPKKHVSKKYRVLLEKEFTEEDKKHIESGLKIDHGETNLLPGEVEIINSKEIILTLKEGKFHQVKKMMASLNNRVLELHRESFDKWNLKELNLKVGEYKILDL